MPAPKGNEYVRVSFNIEEGLLEKLLLCMEYEDVHSQSEALRLAVREWIKNTLERMDKKELVKEVVKLKEEIVLLKQMYLQEQKINGVMKKKLQKELKKETKDDSIEDQLF